jgi:hypothetical protein
MRSLFDLQSPGEDATQGRGLRIGAALRAEG